MNLGFPAPNVTCRCGTILWSWAAVEKHWAQHQDEKRSVQEMQKRMDAYAKTPVADTCLPRGKQ